MENLLKSFTTRKTSGGWVDGGMVGLKAILRIAHSYQKLLNSELFYQSFVFGLLYRAGSSSIGQKKQMLRSQLAGLRMLSNATEQMTERVNKILLQRMAGKNDFARTQQSKQGSPRSGGRIINWNIENQGKQTIIIL